MSGFLINPFVFAGAAGDFESIATVTVGSGGASYIEFSSIPATGYQHLQIRGIVRSSRSATADAFEMQLNSDTGSNYAYHQLFGNGSSAFSSANTSYSAILVAYGAAANSGANAFDAFAIDVLDYSDTGKNTTVRALEGSEDNTGTNCFVALRSGLWLDTSAVSSIKVFAQNGNLAQYSTVALYGIKA